MTRPAIYNEATSLLNPDLTASTFKAEIFFPVVIPKACMQPTSRLVTSAGKPPIRAGYFRSILG